MDQTNSRTYAALGVAGQMGCFMLIMVIAALLVGLGLERVIGGRVAGSARWVPLICVLVSIPINLVVTIFITRRLIARVILPNQPKSGATPPGDEEN